MRLIAGIALVWAAYGLQAPSANAQPVPTIACDVHKPDTEWLLKPSAKLEWACGQSVMTQKAILPNGGAGFDPLKSQPMNDGITAAFSGQTLQGFRLWHPSGPPPIPEDPMMDLSPATITEQGHWGETGELWWGRLDQGEARCCRLNNRAANALQVEHPWWIVVGQETMVRRYKAITEPKQYLRLMSGKISPWSDLSDKGSVRFTLESASLLRNVYGSYNRWLRQEQLTVRDAQLELTLENQLSGTLQLQVESGRGKETLQLPVKRDVDEAPSAPAPRVAGLSYFRLTQGYVNAQGAIQKCRYDSDCFYTRPDDPERHMLTDPQYRVRGMFFGAEGQYLAVLLEACLMQAGPDNPNTDSGERPRIFGVVVLKRAKS